MIKLIWDIMQVVDIYDQAYLRHDKVVDIYEKAYMRLNASCWYIW